MSASPSRSSRDTRRKKSPTPSTAKKTGAELRAALPEGLPSRVYPPQEAAKAAKTAKAAGKSALGKLAAFGGDGPLEERVAALEAELAAVKALAEGAQRAAFRIAWKFDSLGAGFRRLVAETEGDEIGVTEPLDGAISDEEGDRAERISDGDEREAVKRAPTVSVPVVEIDGDALHRERGYTVTPRASEIGR